LATNWQFVASLVVFYIPLVLQVANLQIYQAAICWQPKKVANQLRTSWQLVGNPGCQHRLATSFQLVRLVGCGPNELSYEHLFTLISFSAPKYTMSSILFSPFYSRTHFCTYVCDYLYRLLNGGNYNIVTVVPVFLSIASSSSLLQWSLNGGRTTHQRLSQRVDVTSPIVLSLLNFDRNTQKLCHDFVLHFIEHVSSTPRHLY